VKKSLERREQTPHGTTGGRERRMAENSIRGEEGSEGEKRKRVEPA